MSLIKKSLIYKVIDMFESLYYYVKHYNTIKDILYGDEFKKLLKEYINIDLRKDWIGRLYGVINPNIDKDGKLDVNNTIIEIDGYNTNSNVYVKNWLYKQMYTVGTLFKLKNLYSYITMDIEHVGPLDQDNYLVIFDIASRQIFVESFKRVIKHALFYGIIASIIMFIYFL